MSLRLYTPARQTMPEERPLPQSRFGRLARMAAVGVRSGASLLTDRGGGSAAEHAAEVLGNLRGLAAKVGQMASYVDGLVPEQHAPAFEASLKALRAQAPRSAPEAIRAVVEQDLGAPIDVLFAEWDDVPLASASIGQVHRARLADGRELAVKVQHPGIARAVESDLANASLLESFVGVLGGRRFDSKAMLQVIRTRFREELDYVHEAENLRGFAALHAGDPTVLVPALIDSHSSKRVLCTELARGMTFDEACAGPEADRAAWARTMWRFVFKGTLVGGKLNADPHPGNYVFHPGGRVTFLDYGCIQPIAERRPLAVRTHRAALARDDAAFAQAVRVMVGAKPGPLADLAVSYTRQCFSALFDSPYRMTKPFAAQLVDGMREMAVIARKVPDEQFFTMPAEMLFVNRLQFGFYSVLARLDVEVDYAAVESAFIDLAAP
jgi:predicted unusual protein kinase regulating ubiquinone biosynthesis (AarF/ABC1/UbiB family)